jgi:uncharacterized protein YyaL (SSP411 family)/cytochrome c biogenesis protein CcdA
MRKFIPILLILILVIPLVSANQKYNRTATEDLYPLLDWQDYSQDTFAKAIDQQKPIFLVISAPSWCYWCHVYESRDYLYQEDLYPYINKQFIPIFVDSDQRPDLTKKYLEGGWPSTTIFTPNLIRIEGFTGPRDPQGIKRYLESVVDYLKDEQFNDSTIRVKYTPSKYTIPSKQRLQQLEPSYIATIQNAFDPLHGGFGLGDAPEWREGQKFPRGLSLTFIVQKYQEVQDPILLEIINKTTEAHYTSIDELDSRYHLYDPVEGGFHRYATKRDWSVPHYEKMARDQAKFLLAYHQMESINSKSILMRDGTLHYLNTKLVGNQGEFYSSQDAHLEAAYYEQPATIRNSLPDPFIDKRVRVSDNALLSYALLQLKDPQATSLANANLNFIKTEMVSENGVAFAWTNETPSLHGQSIANSWTLLAFTEANETTTATNIADYTIDNLYDWNGGGFFERNSPDSNSYAPNERIDTTKPYEENAVFSFALLRLYQQTNNPLYLHAGLTTLGWLSAKPVQLDESYFTIQAANLALDNNLLQEYEERSVEVSQLVTNGRDSFFINDMILDDGSIKLQDPPKLISAFADPSLLLLMFIAMLAGLLSVLSPCTLPVIAAFIGFATKSKKAVRTSIAFSAGLMTTFILLGILAGLLGSIIREYANSLAILAGLLIITLGLIEIFGTGFSGLQFSRRPRNSYLFGLSFGIGWSACVGPILASILLLATDQNTIFRSILLMGSYAVGFALTIILFGVFFKQLKSSSLWNVVKKRSIKFSIGSRRFDIHIVSLIAGLLLIAIGLLLVSGQLYALNNLALQTDIVQNVIVTSETALLSIIP